MTADAEFDFPDLPPFPADVPTAPLLRLSLQKLVDGEPGEVSRLWDTSCNVGFFYLDLKGAAGEPSVAHSNGYMSNGHSDEDSHTPINGNNLLLEAERLFGVAEEFFDLPVEEKVKYDFKDQGSYFGYKGYGAGVIDRSGTKDRNEFYNTSKDDILSVSDPVPAPKLFNPYRSLLSSYIKQSHAIINLLLTHLNSSLGLPNSTLTKLHTLHSASGDQVRFVRSPPQPLSDRQAALGAHTDFGSVTLLFNRLGGLQILPPETDGMSEQQKAESWLYVRPLKGHCIVNLGDAMVKFTRGLLRSNIHRVVNPPGEEQGRQTRYSLVYFSRPTDEVILRPLEGSRLIDAKKCAGEEEEEQISAKEWTLRRALGRRGVGDWNKSDGTEGSRGMRVMSEVGVQS